MIELFCISNFYIFQYFRLYNQKEKTRKSKANDEEECSPGSLNKIENHSTEKYIMHCSNSNENLTRLQLCKPWRVLLDFAKIRQHQAASTVSEKEMPDILYHRKCGIIFTLKNTLKRIQEQEEVWYTFLS